jgi:RNA polymerase sigma-70 factor, ECF subfamily
MVRVLQLADGGRAKARRAVGMLEPERTADLVARAQRGEAEAYAELVRAFLRPAYSVALAILRRPADAEDVAQEALLVGLEKLATCHEPKRFAGWLLTIVRHRALNALDSRQRRESPVDEGARGRSIEPLRPERIGLRERLLEALGRLSPLQRQVVLLCDLEGWTHAEVGAALGISELTSRQHLFNARRTLRNLLAPEAPVEVQRGR